jgi:hypothetical protein
LPFIWRDSAKILEPSARVVSPGWDWNQSPPKSLLPELTCAHILLWECVIMARKLDCSRINTHDLISSTLLPFLFLCVCNQAHNQTMNTVDRAASRARAYMYIHLYVYIMFYYTV